METRKMTLEGWVKSGAGATADSYNCTSDPHIMLKVFNSSLVGPQYAQSEFGLSEKVSALGLKTPRALELVDCDGFPAIIYERIVQKRSISRLCASNPEDIDRWATVFARESAALHATVCQPDDFVSRKEQMLKFVNGHKGYRERTKAGIAALAAGLDDTPHCLHGDLQTGNIIVDSETGTAYWIDLGSFAWGDPMYDIACLYFFCKHPIGRLVGRKLCHLSFRRLSQFWNAFEREYSKCTGASGLAEKASRYVILYLVYTIGLENYGRIATFAFDAYINRLAARPRGQSFLMQRFI
ncbi:MAG: phosphotransferase [Bacteroidetes bacterium]|nr:phosphotransferase [Candidatus Colenecus caballi]